MKREYLIAAHPIQRALLRLVAGRDFDSLSLREMGKAAGVGGSPQQVKHHLTAMVKYGFLDVVNGKYRVGSQLKRIGK